MHPLTADDPRRIGPYRTLALLGSGGMGHVYLGTDGAGRHAAVKVVRAEYAYDPDFRERFVRELALATRVHGEQIPRVYSAGPYDEVPWLATEYVPGPSLQELVERAGPLPEPAAVAMARGIARVLVGVHDAGFAHRDLKPGNVMVAPSGPRVIDFGIARAVEESRLARDDEETKILGTPGYMAPEVSNGGEGGAPADVFALGGLLVFALTGIGAFGDGHPSAVLYRTHHLKPRLDGVPPALHDLVAACLDKDPALRPTASRVLQDLGGPLPSAPNARGWLPSTAAAVVDGVGSEYRALLRTTSPGRDLPGYRARNLLTVGAAATAVVLMVGLGVWTQARPLASAISASLTAEEPDDAVAPEPCDPRDVADTFAEASAPVPTIPGDGHWARLAFSHGGSVLAVGGTDGIALWDWEDGTEVALLDLFVLQYTSVTPVFSPDDCRIAYADRDGVHLYTLATGDYEVVLEGNTVNVAAFSPDGRSLVTDPGVGLQAVELDSGNRTVYRGDDLTIFKQAAFSPDGTHIAGLSRDEGLWLWDTGTGETVVHLSNAVLGDGHNSFALLDDGGVLYMTEDHPVVWHPGSSGDGEALEVSEEYQEETAGLMHEIAYNPTHDLVYALYVSDPLPDLTNDVHLLLWHASTGEPYENEDLEPPGPPAGIVAHPDGETVAAAATGAEGVMLLDALTLQEDGRLG
ncbi:protein kinase [Nocardiopsis sp. NPDC006938]|uniref:protein kinase domain-containing protein n=1 Tax=Nocardiopsis sp. NPDC006938 TaxID=3364337 RepID=UPI0036774AE8